MFGKLAAAGPVFSVRRTAGILRPNNYNYNTDQLPESP